MSQAGFRPRAEAEAGFTLFEMLIVMVILSMTVAAISVLFRGSSSSTQLRTAAQVTASRLRDLRAAAIETGSERIAEIEPSAHAMQFSDGRPPLDLGSSIDITVTAAEGERRSATKAGVRFFPNGSSSGATITLKSERQAYEVRVNWLTGRVSTSALD